MRERNGILGLEVVAPDEVERAAALFHRDGFVAVRDVLPADQLERLRVAAAEVIEQVSSIGSDLAPHKQAAIRPRDQLDTTGQLVLDAVPKHLAAPTRSIAVVAGVSPEVAGATLASLRDVELVDGDETQGWRLAAR